MVRKYRNNTEIVAVGGRPSAQLRVVRGKPEPAAERGTEETVAFSGGKPAEVHVLRGAPVVAAVSIFLPAGPRRRRSGVYTQIVSFASRRGGSVTVLRGAPPAVGFVLPAVVMSPTLGLFPAAQGAELDRVAFAVDGAESSHGADPGMWRPEFAGPQGPMQVSAAAAADTGGGDRFDLAENRLLGRAYLARLYRRYGNWPDAIAAYNWGPGNLDSWIAQGRPAVGLPVEVAHYCDRVLRDGGITPDLGAALTNAAGPAP